ncbi:MAG: hypothetical protein E7069_12605 [Bacteroidales bacterium]|jgi:hypothetical protein|nr:hypothetical protein [Bacteroidales bacterium]
MFYLTSTEYENLRGPIICEIISNVYVNKRQVILVRITPPMAGIDYGVGFRAITHLLLVAKYKDKEIKALDKFPIDVVVFLPDNFEDPLNIDRKWSEMNSIGWAELCKE